MVTTVAVLGSTGSIGTQTLDVIDRHPERFAVQSLAAGRASRLLIDQIERYQPTQVVVANELAAHELVGAGIDRSLVSIGATGLETAAGDADVTVNAVLGFAGLPATLGALRAGRRLALANKESLIAAAPLVEQVRSTPGAEIVPVDSEHCAIHQCLSVVGGGAGSVRRVLLTASGGPFRTATTDELADVGVEDALAHPTWSMGPKITIDSSTLMNKGLEVIEAHALFGIGFDAIEVVVHPQSIVHSMVEFVDGSTIAQLSMPDMRLPISYALGYPERLDVAFGPVDFAGGISMTFEAPDLERFPALELAYGAGRVGGAAPAWLSAANEIAVEAFLAERLSWFGIAEVVSEAMERFVPRDLVDVEDVLIADGEARDVTRAIVQGRMER